jgi:hypothetical protein
VGVAQRGGESHCATPLVLAFMRKIGVGGYLSECLLIGLRLAGVCSAYEWLSISLVSVLADNLKNKHKTQQNIFQIFLDISESEEESTFSQRLKTNKEK